MNAALRSGFKNTLRLIHLRALRPTVSFATSVQKPAESQRQRQEKDEETVSNEPMLFLGSNAASWRAKASRSGGADEALWYQTYVISASLTVFLLYFCVLREENDVDEKLGKSLFDHVGGLEEATLVITYKYNKEHGIDNSEVVARLKELSIDVESLTSGS